MKINDNGIPTVDPLDALVVDVDTENGGIQVYRDTANAYFVVRDGVVRHPNGTAEDAMRALGFYLQGVVTNPGPNSPQGMRTPPDDGPIKGTAIAAKMASICGCQGKFNCDCVSIRNQARRELWTERNLCIGAE